MAFLSFVSSSSMPQVEFVPAKELLDDCSRAIVAVTAAVTFIGRCGQQREDEIRVVSGAAVEETEGEDRESCCGPENFGIEMAVVAAAQPSPPQQPRTQPPRPATPFNRSLDDYDYDDSSDSVDTDDGLEYDDVWTTKIRGHRDPSVHFTSFWNPSYRVEIGREVTTMPPVNHDTVNVFAAAAAAVVEAEAPAPASDADAHEDDEDDEDDEWVMADGFTIAEAMAKAMMDKRTAAKQ